MLRSRAFAAMGPGGGRAIILMCVFTVGAQRNAVPQWEAASRMSACGGRGGAGDRPDVREHAAGVPGWEGSHEPRGAVELDPVLAGGLGPGELAGVPFDERFGFRRDVEVLVQGGVRLARWKEGRVGKESVRRGRCG